MASFFTPLALVWCIVVSLLSSPAWGQSFSVTGSLINARENQTATLLPNGKVLVAGGDYDNSAIASAELYDPATGNWTATGSLAACRTFCATNIWVEG